MNSSQQSADSRNSHPATDLFGTVTERQLRRPWSASLGYHQRRAEPSDSAEVVLHRAADEVLCSLDSRQARQQDRVWRTLMGD